MRVQTLILGAALLGFPGYPQADATSLRPDASCPDLDGAWRCMGIVDVFQPPTADPDVPYSVDICDERKIPRIPKRKLRKRIEMNCFAEKDIWSQKASVFIADGKTRTLWSVENPHTGRITVKAHASCLAGVLTATHDSYTAVDGYDVLAMSSMRTFKAAKVRDRTKRVLEVIEQELSPEEGGMVVEVERKARCVPVVPGSPPSVTEAP